MAQIRWYLAGGATNEGWQQLTETAQSAVTLSTGWVVGTGATLNSEFASGSGGDRASTTFVGSTVPDGTLDLALLDAFRTVSSYNGTFASANWTFQFTVQSPVQGGAADGQIVFRLIKANADGSGATEITSGQQSASVVTNATTTDLSSTLTFNPGAITLVDQYLFVQVAWKRTGAGGMTTTTIRLRTGVSATVGTTILSADFTDTPPTLVRVQETGKVKVASPTTSINLTFPVPPTVGNGLVIMMTGSVAVAGVGMTFVGATDNFGNAYLLVQQRQISTNIDIAVAILYCKRVITTGAGFTITVSGDRTDHGWCGSAVEIGGMAGFELKDVVSTSGSGFSVTPGTGITAVAGEGLLAGAMTRFNNSSSITVEALTPAWVEHHEELGIVTSGEGDTRILNLTASGTFINWTMGTASNYADALVEFKKSALTVPPATATLTQTLASATVVSAGTVMPSRTADLTRTLASATVVSDVDAIATTTLTRTLGAATLASDASVVALPARLATVTMTLGAATLASDASVVAVAGRTATVTQTLGAATVSATTTVVALPALTGTLAQTLANTTLSATATVVALPARTASVTQTLANAALSATATVVALPARTASVTVTLDAVTLASATSHGRDLALAQGIGPVSVTAVGQILSGAVVAAILGTVGLNSALTTGSGATLGVTLAGASLESAGIRIEESREVSANTFMWLT